MSTKPATIPSWNTGGANRTTPTPTKLALGHTNGGQPASSEENWLSYWLCKWVEYLSDGALTGNHTIGGTLGVTGLITASAGVTAAANQHITVSGTGEFKHGERTLAISPFAAARTANFTVLSDAGGYIGTTTGAADALIALPLHKGDRIKVVKFRCTGDGTVDGTGTVFIGRANGTSDSIGTGTATNPTAGAGTLVSIDVTDTTLADGESAFIMVSANAANFHLHTIEVVYDRP